MANNIIKRDESGILTVLESGYQTSESIRELNQRVAKEVKRLQDAKKPKLILVDLTRITGHDKGSEAEGMQTLRIPFDAMAIFTDKRADRVLINMLAILYSSRDRVRTFKTAREALLWLEDFERV